MKVFRAKLCNSMKTRNTQISSIVIIHRKSIFYCNGKSSNNSWAAIKPHYKGTEPTFVNCARQEVVNITREKQDTVNKMLNTILQKKTDRNLRNY